MKLRYIFFLLILIVPFVSADFWIGQQPLGYWKFDNSRNDSSGNNYTLQDASNSTGFVPGKLNNSINITQQTNAKLYNFSFPTQFTGEAFTIAFWYNKTGASPNNQRIITNDVSDFGTDGLWAIYTDSVFGTVKAHFRNSSTLINDITVQDNSLPLNDSLWHRIIVTRSNTTEANAVKLYVDGNLVDQENFNTSVGFNRPSQRFRVGFGGVSPPSQYLNRTRLDDIQIFRYEWNSDEVDMDWNNGAGLTADADLDNGAQILYPEINENFLYPPSNFSALLKFPNITNATLYIWNKDNGIFHNAFKSGSEIEALNNVSSFSSPQLLVGDYDWNVYVCGDNGTQQDTCQFGQIFNRSFTAYEEVISNAFDINVYETAGEVFATNITIPNFSIIQTANLIYGGVSYPGTVTQLSGNNYSLAAQADVPLATSSQNWLWQIRYNSNRFHNTTAQSQSISQILLSFCNSTSNVLYANFTYKNETASEERVNASITSSWSYWLSTGTGLQNKSLNYNNATERFSHEFCFLPTDQEFTTNLVYNYQNSYSAQRTYSPTDITFNNSASPLTLFLLPSTQGTSVTFQVISASLQPISGVLISAARSGLGTIESQVTDAAGSATLFLSTDFVYTITASKEGFNTFTSTINPASSPTFTITLSTTDDSETLPNLFRGISFDIDPREILIPNHTDVNFNFTIESNFYILEEWGFVLKNASGANLGTTSSGLDTGGTLSSTINTGNNTLIIMNAYWIINSTYTNVTKQWIVSDTTDSSFSISNFFNRLLLYITSDSDPDGLFGLTKKDGFNFGLSLILFFVIFLFAGVMSYKFGLNSPAAIGTFFFATVFFFDITLDLIPKASNGVPIATIIVGLILVGLLVRESNV